MARRPFERCGVRCSFRCSRPSTALASMSRMASARLARIEREQDGDQAADDMGVAVADEAEARDAVVRTRPWSRARPGSRSLAPCWRRCAPLRQRLQASGRARSRSDSGPPSRREARNRRRSPRSSRAAGSHSPALVVWSPYQEYRRNCRGLRPVAKRNWRALKVGKGREPPFVRAPRQAPTCRNPTASGAYVPAGRGPLQAGRRSSRAQRVLRAGGLDAGRLDGHLGLGPTVDARLGHGGLIEARLLARLFGGGGCAIAGARCIESVKVARAAAFRRRRRQTRSFP